MPTPITDAAIDEVIATLEAVKGTGLRAYVLVFQSPTEAQVTLMHPGVAGFGALKGMLQHASEVVEEEL